MTDESRIEVHKNSAIGRFFDQYAPGGGYAFYTGDGRQAALEIESGAF